MPANEILQAFFIADTEANSLPLHFFLTHPQLLNPKASSSSPEIIRA